MAGLKDYQISVYVANLGKYAEGVLQGAWITLPMPAERLQDTLKTEVGLGGRYEEYAIHDYEGGEGLLATVANPGEYESLTDLNLMCRAFEAREDDDPDVYEKVQTVRDDLDAVPRTPLQYANLALNSDEIPYHSYDAPLWPDSKEAKYAWTAVNQGWASEFKDCEIDHIWDENGILKMRGHHHDGSVEVEIRQLTDQGCEALESYEQSWAGEPFDAAGRHYDGGKESVDRFWNDLKTDRGLAVEPRYVELAFGCPPIEWDIDARVRDFAERMGDEYTSLYEQDTTGIKGGDFERFGAFADNHLDFIRALTKARGMDPISSDREIAAFLNTFDKLAAMPEPSPASQEKDELSAGVCDPTDPTMGCLQPDSPAAIR